VLGTKLLIIEEGLLEEYGSGGERQEEGELAIEVYVCDEKGCETEE
jgi:hypothetical protein